MKYYLAAEGGGSKLLAFVYDENFRIISSGKAYGTNGLFRNGEDIRKDLSDLACQLFPSEGTVCIERADVSLMCPEKLFIDSMRERAEIVSSVRHDEGKTALGASGNRFGIVALSGTGSDAFLIQRDIFRTVGGWGADLGDEGSGYDIGRNGLRAAIYSTDGRGEKTAILDHIREHFGISDLREMFGILYRDGDRRREIASVSRDVAKAAYEGDRIALDIFRNAGTDLALQVKAVVSQNGGTWEGPVVLSGGAWRGHPVMKEAFSEMILREYPGAVIEYPYFEPVIGTVFLRMTESGMTDRDAFEILKNNFAVYRDPHYTGEIS